jgi:hypothetical protein
MQRRAYDAYQYYFRYQTTWATVMTEECNCEACRARRAPVKEMCNNCRFWRQVEPKEPEAGECRFNAPVAISFQEAWAFAWIKAYLSGNRNKNAELYDGWNVQWPVTAYVEWCGKYVWDGLPAENS